jgi:hypothetical protein
MNYSEIKGVDITNSTLTNSQIENNNDGDNPRKRKTTGIKNSLFKRLLVICMITSLILSSPIGVGIANAADTGTSVTVAVDYTQEIATVNAGPGGSTKFYMSIDGRKTWELIDAISSRMVDLSSILSTKEVTVYFKGNKDTNEVPFVFPAEDAKDLTVSYKISNGVGQIFYTSTTTPIEYRKGANGSWKPLTISGSMYTSIYEIKGATLYFRTTATVGKRAGKTISVKVNKRPSALSAKVDGSKLQLTGLKPGETWYRVNDSSDTLFPKIDSKITYLDLKEKLGISPAGTILGGTIEVYNKGTDKKLTSSVKVINIAPQAPAPQNMTLTGTTLVVTDANTKTYYEYTVVNLTSTFDPLKAKWTQMTSKNPVIIKKASIGDKVYMRVKSTTDPNTKQPILASAYRIEDVKSITLK